VQTHPSSFDRVSRVSASEGPELEGRSGLDRAQCAGARPHRL